LIGISDSASRAAMMALPWYVLVAIVSGWVNRHQQTVIEYLIEENRFLKQQLGKRRLRFTGDHGERPN
jgi:hypothetical protein